MQQRVLKSVSVLVGVGLLLASCSGREAADPKGAVVTHNDFESVLGWGGAADASLTTERAHSGKYAVRVGPQNKFGYTYIQTLGNMSNARAKAITVSAWVWLPSAQASASLVLAISHSPEISTPVFYSSTPLNTAVKSFKDWQFVSHTFLLPDSVQDTNQLKCYLWQASATENAYADDMTINVSK